MLGITEEQRTELVKYMKKRPYEEVFVLMGMLFSLKPAKLEKENDSKDKKNLS